MHTISNKCVICGEDIPADRLYCDHCLDMIISLDRNGRTPKFGLIEKLIKEFKNKFAR